MDFSPDAITRMQGVGSADDIMENFLLTNRYRAELIDNPPSPLPPHLDGVEMWRRAHFCR